MLILGGITISIVFNEDGVISKAQEAKEKTEIAQLQERLELAKLSAYINEEYKFNLDDYFQSLEDEGIIGSKEEDIVDNGDGTYEITTDDGYIFEITVKPDKENPEEVEIEYSGKVDEPRIRKINATRVNDSTITVEVETINAEGATYTYSYKKDGETEWVEVSTGNSSNTYRFEGLDEETGYIIKVKIEIEGKSIEKEVTVAAPEEIPGGDTALTDGTITVGEEQWSNGQASIEVSTNTGLQIQYQINAIIEENWETPRQGTITGLRDGDKVNIRLTNGTKYGEPVTITISDEKSPEKATITPNTTSVIIGETLTATVTHTDNESGVDIANSKWVMTESSAEIGTAEGDISKYTGSFTTNGETLRLNSSTAGTYYLHVLTVDNAGNRTETVSEAITIGALAGTVSQSGEITWSAGQATLVLQSSDSNYQIVYKVNGEGSWKEYNGTSITGLNHGDKVTACLTNEGQTTYGPEATFEIKDETVPVITEESSNTTTNSVTLTVTAVDNEAGLPDTLNYKFEIKETSAEDSTYEEIQTGSNATATKSGLTQGTSYTIRVTLQDKAGNTGTYTKELTTKTVGGASEGLEEGNIVATNPQWSNGQASITLSTTTGLQIQYQINGTEESSWSEGANSPVTVDKLNHGDTVYARLWDGTNAGDHSSVSITDNIAPTKATIAPNTTSLLIGETLTATVTHTDNESGVDIGNSKWVMTTNSEEIGTEEGNISKYTGNFTTNGETLTLDNTKAGTYYLHVLTGDNAGNRTETVSEAITISGITGTVTQNGNITWSAGQATLKLQSSDSNYQIVYKINGEGSWEKYNGTSIQGLNHGDTVTACLTNEGQTTYGPEATFTIQDTTNPIVTVTALGSPSTNSIAVTVQVIDNESGMKENPTYTYYIKQSGQGEGNYTTPSGASNIANAQYTFTGLTQTTSYDIKVEVNGDKAGNKGTGTLANQKTDTVPGASVGLETGNIIASPVVWQNGKASITLSTTTNYQIQYQINNTTEGSWSEGANSPITVGNLNHGDTVYARLWDGTNAGSDSSVSIEDNIAPSAPTINLSGTLGNNGYYRSNVTVAITAGSDEQSGVNQIRYSVSGAQTIAETTTTAGTTSANITISTDGTSTITAYTIDKAGKVSGAKTQVVNKDSTAPNTASLTTGTVGETSIAVTAKGTDATSGIYSYQFQRSTTSATTGFTKVETPTSTATSYNYTYTGLTSGTKYYLKVIVTDKAGNTKEATTTATTKTAGISETNSYVGSYADVDGNGSVDGIIYADLAIGGSGQWTDGDGTYTIPKGSNFKKYTVSGSHTENGFGTKDVIKVSNGSGNERFYVMALKDVDTSTHYWYYNAYGNMSDYASTTSGDFGTGEKNTQTMISKWKSSAYGSQNSNDMWGLSAVQNGTWNGSSGWYVPSRGEWAAFGAAFNITSSNYTSYGLSSSCWSSSQGNADDAWSAYFHSGYMSGRDVNGNTYVRLGTTF